MLLSHTHKCGALWIFLKMAPFSPEEAVLVWFNDLKRVKDQFCLVENVSFFYLRHYYKRYFIVKYIVYSIFET